MSFYTVEGSGRVKAEGIIVGRGTIQTPQEYIPRTKIDVIVKDNQVEQLVSELTDTLVSELGEKICVVDIPIAVDLGTKKLEKMPSKQEPAETPMYNLCLFNVCSGFALYYNCIFYCLLLLQGSLSSIF
jgi:nitrogen regulatory protein PII